MQRRPVKVCISVLMMLGLGNRAVFCSGHRLGWRLPGWLHFSQLQASFQRWFVMTTITFAQSGAPVSIYRYCTER
jgi:hypothetical protein